jgi:hypothetical protein
MSSDNPKSHLSIDSIGPEIIRDSQLQLNLRQTIIVVTEDKALLCIQDYEKTLGRNREWVAPGSVLTAIVLALASADFKETLGIPGATWEALFWLLAVGAGVWLLAALLRIRRATTPTDVVHTLMAAGQVEHVSDAVTGTASSTTTGKWEGQIQYGETYQATMELDEDMDGAVSGVLILIQPTGEEVHEKLSGKHEDGRVTLEGEVLGRAGESWDPDTLTLALTGDGLLLSGACSDDQGNSGKAQFTRRS